MKRDSVVLTNTRWMGDPARVIMSGAVIKEIIANGLVEKCVSSSTLQQIPLVIC
jgi:hypothetical protein